MRFKISISSQINHFPKHLDRSTKCSSKTRTRNKLSQLSEYAAQESNQEAINYHWKHRRSTVTRYAFKPQWLAAVTHPQLVSNRICLQARGLLNRIQFANIGRPNEHVEIHVWYLTHCLHVVTAKVSDTVANIIINTECTIRWRQWQSQIQDFPKEGAPFVSQVDAIQWGGGVVAEMFPWSTKTYAIQWGGGSSRIFPWSPKTGATQG